MMNWKQKTTNFAPDVKAWLNKIPNSIISILSLWTIIVDSSTLTTNPCLYTNSTIYLLAEQKTSTLLGNC